MFIAGGGDQMEEFNGRQFMVSGGSCIWLLERRRLFFPFHPSQSSTPLFCFGRKKYCCGESDYGACGHTLLHAEGLLHALEDGRGGEEKAGVSN
jgi:hypothetical protein